MGDDGVGSYNETESRKMAYNDLSMTPAKRECRFGLGRRQNGTESRRRGEQLGGFTCEDMNTDRSLAASLAKI